VHVQRGDGVAAIRQAAPGSLDVIFIDPPFDAPLFEPHWARVPVRWRLKAGCIWSRPLRIPMKL